MTRNVGIWIDHKKAVVVFASTGQVTTLTLESEIGPHARFSGRAEYPSADGSRAGGGERHYEGRFGEHLERYYDEVLDRVGRPDALFIFGPGEAKVELAKRIRSSEKRGMNLVGVETTDKLTDPQIVAKVVDRFGLQPGHGGSPLPAPKE